MFLKPDGRIDLEHRASFLRGIPGRSAVVAASGDGHYTVLTPDLKVVDSCRHPSKIAAVSPQPSGQHLAIVDGETGALLLHALEGRHLFEIAPPPVHEDAPRWFSHGFLDCHFDDRGKFLWLFARLDGDKCEIQLIETVAWTLVAKATVTDPFGGSSCSFHPTGRPGLIALWLAAGQDGQQVYWLKREGGAFSCTIEPRLENTTPPAFSPDGEHFLVVNDDNMICKQEFNGMRQCGSPLSSAEEDDPFGYQLAFLDETRALVGSGEGRIYAVDVSRMVIEAEVALEGHETRPIGVYYPTLAHEGGLATDIRDFERLGNVIFFAYRRDRGSDLLGWKDTLLWMSATGRDVSAETPRAR